MIDLKIIYIINIIIIYNELLTNCVNEQKKLL